MILTDAEISAISKTHGMIEPFLNKSVNVLESGRKVPSFGLSSCGYDIRIDENFKVFHQTEEGVISPEDFDSRHYTFHKAQDEFLLPPRAFALANTIEYFRMPEDVIGICTGKSTWARCGLDILVTPLEPGWEGYLTLELVNHTDKAIRIPVGCGIAQINFFKGTSSPKVGYHTRNGKYMKQEKMPVDPRL